MTEREKLVKLLRADIKNECDKHEKCVGCPYENDREACYNHLATATADYLLANGVIVPPCKVGDKVYSIIYQKKNVVSHILIEEYVGIHLSNAPDLRGHRRKNYIIVWNENTNSIRHIDINKIGKTVFLTKEEAEAKLKELGE